MSFKQLKKDILMQVAEDFAVDLSSTDPDDMTKDEIIEALKADGVTWELYKEAYPSVMDQPDVAPEDAIKAGPLAEETEEDDQSDDDEEPVEEDSTEASKKFSDKPKQVLVKMTRANGSYEIRGYTFTRQHPFLPVSEEDAIYLTENIKGFKIANPRELEEYYS